MAQDTESTLKPGERWHSGTVKWFRDFRDGRCYGYIIAGDGTEDVFVGNKALRGKAAEWGLAKGDPVRYVLNITLRGRTAVRCEFDHGKEENGKERDDQTGEPDTGDLGHD